MKGGEAGSRGVTALRLLALAAVAVVIGAGCGGDEEPSAEDWANGVCSAFTDWRDAVTAAGESLRSGAPTRDDLESAADDLEEATETFADDLRDLEPLETEAGAEAQQALDQLAEDVDQNKEDMRAAVGGAEGLQGAAEAASSIAATLTLMGRQIEDTFRELQQLEPGGELSDAFDTADDCASVSG
jgi:hypothetical protein